MVKEYKRLLQQSTIIHSIPHGNAIRKPRFHTNFQTGRYNSTVTLIWVF